MRPIACTLSRTDLAAQQERWHRLTLVDRAETADGVELHVRSTGDGVAALHGMFTSF